MRTTALTLALLAACGARTELTRGHRGNAAGSSTNGADGAGGATTDSTTTSVGGSGGAAPSTTGTMSTTGTGGNLDLVCDTLTASGQLTTIPTLGPGTSDNARFHLLDATRLAVFHRPFDSTLGLRLASTTVEWTQAWPPKSDAPVQIIANLKESFAIDKSAHPLVAVLTPHAEAPGVAFGTVDPAVGAWVPKLTADFSADRSVFVRYGLGEYFIGMSAPGTSPGGSTQLRAAFYDGSKLRGPYNVGCSATPILGDALAIPQGWLLARTAPQQATCNPALPAPNSQAISIDLIVGGMPLIGGEVPFGGKSHQLAFVPRGDGAWLLYWSDAITLSGLAIDSFGKIEGVVPIAKLTEKSFAFAADALDDGMVVVLFDELSSGETTLRTIVTNANGTTIATASLANPPKLTTLPQVAFDPATRQVLVGFAGITNAVQSVYLARYQCE